MTHRPPSSPTTRRQFLQTSAVATTALGTLALARSAHAGGQETVKVGLIGCGGRGLGAANQALQVGPYVKLAGLCDVFADRLQRGRRELVQLRGDQAQISDDQCFVGFDGYKHVIEQADVVLIACASKFHPYYAEAAIRAGKHVFVEKPHGIDPAGVQRIQAACDLAKEKGLSLVSGLQSRFHRGWQETMQRIHDGSIGDIVAIQAMFLRGPYGLVGRDPKLTEVEYQFRNWYHFCWLSGDDVTQSLVHNMDRVGWALREETPLKAFGLAGRSSSFGEVYGDMFDHHTVVYEYASGARVYALCRTQTGCYDNMTDVIMGSKGTCYLGQSRIEGEHPWRYDGPQNNPYDDEQRALIESVRSGEPINSGYHMVKSTLAAVLGQLACYSGGQLEWQQVASSNLQFGPAPEEASFAMPPPTLPDESGNYPLPKPGITRLVD